MKSLYINGSWTQGSGPLLESYNPSTGKRVWHGQTASLSDVAHAIQSAKEAFPAWSALSVDERLDFLQAFATVLKERQQQVAEAISQEVGKPMGESKGEVLSMIQKIDISAKAQKERCGIIIAEHPQGKLVTRHHPHGVAAVFGPFNFPGHLPNGHIIPALLAGNTVVFKPSEYAPLTAEETLLCWEKAHLPRGVLNMVQGGHGAGKTLAEHPEIDALFFTGSSAAGQQFIHLFAERPGKILALEMGGNNPLVVSGVSSLTDAVDIIIRSAYLTAGQRCTCARRLILIEEEASSLLKTLIRKVKEITVGPYTDTPEPFMGPVISAKTADHLLAIQERLIELGASSLVPMRSLKPSTGLMSPGLLDITNCKNLPDEEIFGPLLQVVRVATFADAIKEANNTAFGLAAGLLSDSEETYNLFRKSIRAGIVNWNTPLTGASSSAPFGGIGKSGNFRPGAYYAADYCSYPVASIERMKK